MKLVWTYNNLDTLYSIENNRMTIDKKMILISYYYESIKQAKNLGYYTIIYCDQASVKYFDGLIDEIVVREGYNNSKLWDCLKIKVLEERNDDFCLIDGDLILNQRLPDYNADVLFERYETINWSWGYEPTIKFLTDKNVLSIIPEWKSERIPVMNVGLLSFRNDDLKKKYVESWNKLNLLINDNIDKIEIHHGTMVTTQYLLTLLSKNYKIHYNENANNELYNHYAGKIKFEKPIYSYKHMLEKEIKRNII